MLLFIDVTRCMLVVASHLADLVLTDSTLACGVKALANCSVSAASVSGRLSM